MTEVKFRHLLFFILLFILTWFWNWITLIFFAFIIIVIVEDLYKAYTHVSYKKCYYYAEKSGICHFNTYETICTGICEKFVVVKK